MTWNFLHLLCRLVSVKVSLSSRRVTLVDFLSVEKTMERDKQINSFSKVNLHSAGVTFTSPFLHLQHFLYILCLSLVEIFSRASMSLINYAFRHNWKQPLHNNSELMICICKTVICDLHLLFFCRDCFFLFEACGNNYTLKSALALKSILGVMCWEAAAAALPGAKAWLRGLLQIPSTT